MKKIILILIATSMLSCRNNYTDVMPVDYIPVDYQGQWTECDSNVTYNINGLDVTFPYRIHSPNQSPITISYTEIVHGDTVILVSGNIYPNFMFTKEKGYVSEWRNIPGMGDWKCITRQR